MIVDLIDLWHKWQRKREVRRMIESFVTLQMRKARIIRYKREAGLI